MRPEEPKRQRTARRARGSRESGGGRSRRGGPGFGSPAQAATFLSDTSNSFSPETLERLEDSMIANTRDAKKLRDIFTIGAFMTPLFEAMERKFGAEATMSAMSGDLDMGAMQAMRFEVEDSDDDRATIASSAAGMATSLVLVKDDGRWFLDLDETLEQNPEMGAAIQLMGPMLTKQMKPMKDTAAKIARNVKAGDYDTAAEAMSAFQDEIMKQAEEAAEEAAVGVAEGPGEGEAAEGRASGAAAAIRANLKLG